MVTGNDDEYEEEGADEYSDDEYEENEDADDDDDEDDDQERNDGTGDEGTGNSVHCDILFNRLTAWYFLSQPRLVCVGPDVMGKISLTRILMWHGVPLDLLIPQMKKSSTEADYIMSCLVDPKAIASAIEMGVTFGGLKIECKFSQISIQSRAKQGGMNGSCGWKFGDIDRDDWEILVCIGYCEPYHPNPTNIGTVEHKAQRENNTMRVTRDFDWSEQINVNDRKDLDRIQVFVFQRDDPVLFSREGRIRKPIIHPLAFPVKQHHQGDKAEETYQANRYWASDPKLTSLFTFANGKTLQQCAEEHTDLSPALTTHPSSEVAVAAAAADADGGDVAAPRSLLQKLRVGDDDRDDLVARHLLPMLGLRQKIQLCNSISIERTKAPKPSAERFRSKTVAPLQSCLRWHHGGDIDSLVASLGTKTFSASAHYKTHCGGDSRGACGLGAKQLDSKEQIAEGIVPGTTMCGIEIPEVPEYFRRLHAMVPITSTFGLKCQDVDCVRAVSGASDGIKCKFTCRLCPDMLGMCTVQDRKKGIPRRFCYYFHVCQKYAESPAGKADREFTKKYHTFAAVRMSYLGLSKEEQVTAICTPVSNEMDAKQIDADVLFLSFGHEKRLFKLSVAPLKFSKAKFNWPILGTNLYIGVSPTEQARAKLEKDFRAILVERLKALGHDAFWDNFGLEVLDAREQVGGKAVEKEESLQPSLKKVISQRRRKRSTGAGPNTEASSASASTGAISKNNKASATGAGVEKKDPRTEAESKTSSSNNAVSAMEVGVSRSDSSKTSQSSKLGIVKKATKKALSIKTKRHTVANVEKGLVQQRKAQLLGKHDAERKASSVAHPRTAKSVKHHTGSGAKNGANQPGSVLSPPRKVQRVANAEGSKIDHEDLFQGNNCGICFDVECEGDPLVICRKCDFPVHPSCYRKVHHIEISPKEEFFCHECRSVPRDKDSNDAENSGSSSDEDILLRDLKCDSSERKTDNDPDF